jgi:ABC-2 type transport system permease protein
MPDNGRAIAGRFLVFSKGEILTAGAPLTWPAAAAMGDILPLFPIVAGSVLVFAAVTRGLGRRFAADAALAAGVSTTPARVDRRPLTPARFKGGVFGVLMRKELRLLIRDPILLSQVLLRTLYILPMTFILARNAARAPSGGFMGGVVLASGAGAVAFMAGQVAGSLAWIAISAEDAPELLASAPVEGAFIRRAKLVATMVPVAVLLAIPLGVLTVMAPWVGVCAILGSAAAASSSGMINLWFEKPAPRTAFRSRRGGSVIGASAELLIGLGFGIATGMAAAGTLFALVPIIVSTGALAVLRTFAEPDRRY